MGGGGSRTADRVCQKLALGSPALCIVLDKEHWSHTNSDLCGDRHWKETPRHQSMPEVGHCRRVELGLASSMRLA